MDVNDKPKKTNTVSLVGFILSFFTNIIALVLCIIGLNQIKKTNEDGKGLAIAGIIISAVKLFLSFILILFIIVAFHNVSDNVKGAFESTDFDYQSIIEDASESFYKQYGY